MKAIVCREYGPISDLEYQDIDDPRPGPNELVIENEAIGVNFPDGLLVQGLYQARPPTPFVPGMEIVGHVVDKGSEVTEFSTGDRVCAVVPLGAYAQKAKAHKRTAMAISTDMPAGDAVALMCGYGTAYHALKQRGGLQPGEVLAVTGAAGLTGLAAVQIGKAMGGRVIAIASTEEKRKVTLEAGADRALGYDDLRDALKAETDGKGVDIVFEVVGGDVFDQCARAMAWNGRLLVVGFTSGEIPKFPVNLALVKGFSVVGVFWGTFTRREPENHAQNASELLAWYGEGKLRPQVEAEFPLAEAAKALHHIHDRKATGKVILRP